MPISTVKILKGLTTGLCLSVFELYSRWVPLSVVSIVHQIYIIYTFLLVQNTQLNCYSGNCQQNYFLCLLYKLMLFCDMHKVF